MLFPAFIELEGRPCLVVGGGSVALRKAKALADCGAVVTLIAPDVAAPLPDGVNAQRRLFRSDDIGGQALVVAATDERAVNRAVADFCRAKNIPVNAVDEPENCTFFFPAIARKGPMTLAVSSGGAAPVAAQIVRDKAARLLSDDFVAAVARLGAQREILKTRLTDPRERKRYCEEELSKWKD